MSIALMSKVWAIDMVASRKMVLLALSDSANDEGVCWPSVAAVAKKCSMNARSVQRHLVELEECGCLVRDSRSGRSNIFTVTPDTYVTPVPPVTPDTGVTPPLTPTSPQPLTPVSPTPVSGVTPPLTLVSPRIIKEPSGNPNVEPLAEPSLFSGVGQNRLPTDPKVEELTPTARTWAAYCKAYGRRYEVDPVRNATVNGQLSNLVKRLGAAEAPLVAAFYVSHNRRDYVGAKHPTGLLTRDAEGLRTEWATNRTVTDTEAGHADRKQATGNVFGKLIEEAEQRERSA